MTPVVSIDSRKLVKAEVIAARYEVSKDTILRGARKGTIPGRLIKNGAKSYWRFDPAEVDAALIKEGARQQQVG